MIQLKRSACKIAKVNNKQTENFKTSKQGKSLKNGKAGVNKLDTKYDDCGAIL